MSGRVGSITTDIIADGLVFNIDAANRASTTPNTSTTKTFNTINMAISGAFSGNAQYDSSTISPSFGFDGVSDTITTTSGLDFFDGTDQFTVELWFLLTDDASQNKDVISKGNTSTNNTQFFIRKGKNTNGNKIFGFLDNAGSKYVGGATAVSNDTWINVAFVYKGYESSNNDKARIYLNGVNDSDSFASGLPSSLVTTTQPLRIGEWQTAATDFEGNVGCVHIYNRALSATEVMRNFNALKDRMGYVAPLAPLLLDTYTGAAAAYSLRRLSNNYTGNLIRVAKKVSNVESETDIGYNSSNELDTTALAAFASGADNGDVRVVTWYDQSGNGNNITQSTFNSAPWIYDDSSLQTSNGKPAIRTAGNVWLQTSNQPLSSTQQSGFMVGEPISNGNGFMSIFGHGDYRTYFYFSTPQIGLSMVGISKAVSNVGNFAVGDQALISYYNNSSTLFFRQDGSQLGSTSVTPASYGSKDMMIGQYWTGTANGNVNKIFNGYNQEHIVFPSEQSSNISGIETNINTYYGIY